MKGAPGFLFSNMTHYCLPGGYLAEDGGELLSTLTLEMCMLLINKYGVSRFLAA